MGLSKILHFIYTNLYFSKLRMFQVVVAFGETPSGKEIFFTASFRGMDLVDKKYNGSVAMDIK